MAEIRVEKKRGTSSWLWVALLLIVVIAVAIYLWQSGAFGGDTTIGAMQERAQQQLAAWEATWHATKHG